jgi:hypothetical protein
LNVVLREMVGDNAETHFNICKQNLLVIQRFI